MNNQKMNAKGSLRPTAGDRQSSRETNTQIQPASEPEKDNTKTKMPCPNSLPT